MSNTYTYGYCGHKFELTKEEYDFTERNDLWDGLSHMCHEWNIAADPGAWDLMMECYIPYFAFMEESK